MRSSARIPNWPLAFPPAGLCLPPQYLSPLGRCHPPPLVAPVPVPAIYWVARNCISPPSPWIYGSGPPSIGRPHGPWTWGTTVRSSPTTPWTVLTSSTPPPLHLPSAPPFIGPPVALFGSPVSLVVPPRCSLARTSASLSASPPPAMSLPKSRLPVTSLDAAPC